MPLRTCLRCKMGVRLPSIERTLADINALLHRRVEQYYCSFKEDAQPKGADLWSRATFSLNRPCWGRCIRMFPCHSRRQNWLRRRHI